MVCLCLCLYTCGILSSTMCCVSLLPLLVFTAFHASPFIQHLSVQLIVSRSTFELQAFFSSSLYSLFLRVLFSLRSRVGFFFSNVACCCFWVFLLFFFDAPSMLLCCCSVAFAPGCCTNCIHTYSIIPVMKVVSSDHSNHFCCCSRIFSVFLAVSFVSQYVQIFTRAAWI